MDPIPVMTPVMHADSWTFDDTKDDSQYWETSWAADLHDDKWKSDIEFPALQSTFGHCATGCECEHEVATQITPTQRGKDNNKVQQTKEVNAVVEEEVPMEDSRETDIPRPDYEVTRPRRRRPVKFMTGERNCVEMGCDCNGSKGHGPPQGQPTTSRMRSQDLLEHDQSEKVGNETENPFDELKHEPEETDSGEGEHETGDPPHGLVDSSDSETDTKTQSKVTKRRRTRRQRARATLEEAPIAGYSSDSSWMSDNFNPD